MKIAAGRADRFHLDAPDDLIGVLYYGPNEGLVRDRAAAFLRARGAETTALRFDPASLSGRPEALATAMFTPSLLGDGGAIRIRCGDDGVVAAIRGCLAMASQTATPAVIEAASLTPQSALRRLFEKDGRLAAIACYEEDERALRAYLLDRLRAAGRRADDDALSLLVSLADGDRGMAARHLDKLCLYAADRDEDAILDLDDARACCGDAAGSRIDDLVDAAAEDDPPRLDRALNALGADGFEPTALLRLTLRHFALLLEIRAQMSRGASFERAEAGLKPRPFFKRAPILRRQVERWSLGTLIEAIDDLAAAEIACKQTAMPAVALCSRSLHRLRSLPKRARRRMATTP